MNDYVKSNPHFFRLIKRSIWLGLLVLLVCAWLMPAPLQEAADLAVVPNPSKSAWFLLWMQELVAYSNAMVYIIVALAVFFAFLPWLPGTSRATRARWFPRDQRPINWITSTTFVAIVALTVVGLFFRGENWSLVLPF